MKKRLVRKTFDMLDDLAKSENKEVSVNFGQKKPFKVMCCKTTEIPQILCFKGL